MLFESALHAKDSALLARATEGFVPERVLDIHAHILHPDFYQGGNLVPYLVGRELNLADHERAMALLLGPKRLAETLYFGFPSRGNDRPSLHRWLLSKLDDANGSGERKGKGLVLAAPSDEREEVARFLDSGWFVGIKPYHLYAGEGDTTQMEIRSYAPEWMWELCHERKGILMLHLVKDAAVSDPLNQKALRELCEEYSDCRVILAHVARAFNYRTAKGLRELAHLPNLFVDTSVITETEAIRTAIEMLGVGRVLYGSDYPVSHLRGRCVSTGSKFHWLYADANSRDDMTLVGIESLLCLREAAEDLQLCSSEVIQIFHNNAAKMLRVSESVGNFARLT